MAEAAPKSDSLAMLLAVYKEQAEQARHHESQRATVTNYVLIVAGGVLGLLSIENFKGYVPTGLFLIVLGFFGAVVSAKHYERSYFHNRLAAAYRKQMEEIDENLEIDREAARNEQEKSLPRLSKMRLFWLWNSFHIFISFLGFLVILLGFR